MTAQRRVTSVTIKHWSYYVVTTFGPACPPSQCVLCARNKPSRHRPYGLLQPLPVPERPWPAISMNFIEQLPASNGFTAILWLLTARPRKVFSFPPRDTVTAPDVADTFISHVFSKHSIPLHVPLNRESQFTLSLLLQTRLPSSHAPTLHARSPPLSQRSGRMGQQHFGTVPSAPL